MQRLGSIFSRFIGRILRREEAIPADIPSVDMAREIGNDQQLALENWRTARLKSRGETVTTRLKLTKVWRISTFVGTEPEGLEIRRDQALSFEGLLYHPDIGNVEVYGMLPSGTPYSKELAEKHIRRSILEAHPDVKNLYKLVDSALVSSNWYVNSWEAQQRRR